MTAMHLLQTAVDWQVRLESGTLSENDRHAFERWRKEDPNHEQAWKRVNNLLHDSFDLIRESGLRTPPEADAVRHTLLHTRRRQMLRGALAFAGVGVATWIVDRQFPIDQLVADLHTGTGERRTFTLVDGSDLQLNARSAVDLAFTSRQRQVRLRQGAFIAAVAADAQRPFVVQTASVMAGSKNGQFLVSQQHDQTSIVALREAVDIRTSDGQHNVLKEGSGAVFNADGMHVMQGNAATLAAWSYGMLAIENGTMRDVVTAIRPYYSGLIRMSPEVAALRVFGSFPLVDAPDVLRTLSHTLPIRMRQYGSWLIDLRLA